MLCRTNRPHKSQMKITSLAINADLRADYFRMQEVLIVTYFQFQFLLSVCLYSMADQMWTNFDSLIQKLHQRGTSQHTVNANNLCTTAVSGSCWFRICIIWRIDCKGAAFIVNKFTHSLPNRHSTLYISSDWVHKVLNAKCANMLPHTISGLLSNCVSWHSNANTTRHQPICLISYNRSRK